MKNASNSERTNEMKHKGALTALMVLSIVFLMWLETSIYGGIYENIVELIIAIPLGVFTFFLFIGYEYPAMSVIYGYNTKKIMGKCVAYYLLAISAITFLFYLFNGITLDYNNCVKPSAFDIAFQVFSGASMIVYYTANIMMLSFLIWTVWTKTSDNV